MTAQKPPMDPRTFTYGMMTGIAILIGVFAFVSEIAGLKWQPVHVADHK